MSAAPCHSFLLEGGHSHTAVLVYGKCRTTQRRDWFILKQTISGTATVSDSVACLEGHRYRTERSDTAVFQYIMSTVTN